MSNPPAAFDAAHFRAVLSQYPTGVCLVTATGIDGGQIAMVVGSFTSVSLEPPLVAFFTDKGSTSWPKIREAESFCVNVLASDQEDVCRSFSSKASDRFERYGFRIAGSGSPILRDAVAWIDCDIAEVSEAGDHYFILGAVRDLRVQRPHIPLLFFRGGYGGFSAQTMAAGDGAGLITDQLRQVDRIREEMQRLAAQLDCSVSATAQIQDSVVVVASVTAPTMPRDGATLVGQRLPFVPPGSAIFAAWRSPADVETWLNSSRPWLKGPGDDKRTLARYRSALELVRSRGYSVGLISPGQRGLAAALEAAARTDETSYPPDAHAFLQNLTYDPEELTGETRKLIRLITAPVFDRSGAVTLALGAHGYKRPQPGIEEHIKRVRNSAQVATELIGGKAPR